MGHRGMYGYMYMGCYGLGLFSLGKPCTITGFLLRAFNITLESFISVDELKRAVLENATCGTFTHTLPKCILDQHEI